MIGLNSIKPTKGLLKTYSNLKLVEDCIYILLLVIASLVKICDL